MLVVFLGTPFSLSLSLSLSLSIYLSINFYAFSLPLILLLFTTSGFTSVLQAKRRSGKGHEEEEEIWDRAAAYVQGLCAWGF